jgi:HAMP domain-containing protein
MGGLNERLASWRVSRLTAGILLVLCFAAGYLFAAWLSGARDTTPLARICSRIDYVNGLQEELEGQQAASEEVREQFKALVEEWRTALSSRAEEND